MGSVLLVLQLIVAIFLVAVILMQRSNGGALSGLGGDSGIGGLLSARGKGNILTRTTAVLATLFFGLSLALSIYFSRAEVQTVSIVDTAATTDVNIPVNTDATAPVESAANNATEAPSAEPSIPSAPTEPAEPAEPEVPVAE